MGVQVPQAYAGREQAYLKHQLMRGYLEQLTMIIGHSRAKCVTYVDCFAGPWQENNASLSDTSIGISLEIMRRCRNAFIKIGRNVPTFRALYIEKSPRSFKRLQAFLQEPREGIETCAMRGNFADLKQDILDWCGPEAFTFFFIDPKGWKDISMPKLRPLLERPNSEFLINLMYDFVNRAVSQAQFAEEMQELFGEDVSDVLAAATSPQDRESRLVRLYQRRLRAAVPTTGERPHTSAVPVLFPDRNRTKYHLVYVTRHPLGIRKFVEQSEKLDIIQPQVRALVKQNQRIRNTGQLELADAVSLGEAAKTVQRQVPLRTVEEYWLLRLTTQPRSFGLTDFAEMHEETGWFYSTLQEALGTLIAAGRVKNLDAKGPRRANHVDFSKGEKLVRLR